MKFILDVFDENFIRIGNLSDIAFAQYVNPLCDSGSFEVQCDISEEVEYLLLNGKYVLLEAEVMGEILSVASNSEASSRVTLKGALIKRMLEFRCLYRTNTFTASRTSIARQLITNNFISPTAPERAMAIISLSSDEKYSPVSDTISKQMTGGSVALNLQDLLLPEDMGYDLVPIISNVYDAETDDVVTNVSHLEFRVIKGRDKSRFNTEGNEIVEFSKELNNLESSSYTKDTTARKTICVVAGEGEGTARIIEEAGNTGLTGVDRIEVYVDARDLSSTDENGNTLTPEAYLALLSKRGETELKAYTTSEVFDCSIDPNSETFVYELDYSLGDTISVKDSNLSLVASGVVTSITISLTAEGYKIDPVIGYTKLTSVERLKRKGII